MKHVRVSRNTIIGECIFDATPEQVWQAWSDPNVISLWWGPQGFTTTTESIEMKPNGVWKFVMHGPDGRDYHNKIVYIEVAKPEKLVYRHAGEDDTENVKFRVTVNFQEQGSKTKMTMEMVFESAAELERVQKEYGAIEGLEDTMTRLGEYLASKAKIVKP